MGTTQNSFENIVKMNELENHINLKDSMATPDVSTLPRIGKEPVFKMDYKLENSLDSPETKQMRKALKLQEKVLKNLKLKDKL
jgi:hypothetical protein